MTKDEFAYWQSRIENSRFQWTEDEIFRLNKRGAFYYNGGKDGIYIKIHKDGLVEAGTYKDAFPHIGDASFFVKSKRQCADYNEAFKVAMVAGGKKFLLDMFSADVVAPPVPAEKTSVIDTIKAARSAPHHPGRMASSGVLKSEHGSSSLFSRDQPGKTSPDKTKTKGGLEL